MAEPTQIQNLNPRALTPEEHARAGELLAAAAAEDTREGMREQVRAMQARARRDMFLRSVPARFAEADLADLAGWPAEERDQVTGWLDSESPTLFLAGGVGTGKTHAAYAVLRAALERGLWVSGASVLDLLDHLRPKAADSAVPRLAEQADVFLFDDLAAERSTEWAVEQFGGIVDERSREGRRQIVTTNLPYAELEERLGRRVMSRLTGGAVIVVRTGKDQRRDLW